jgi:hypothetical protein
VTTLTLCPVLSCAVLIAAGSQVFDKYVKRGAPLELMLDSHVRNSIVASIDKAHLHLFDTAQQAIFDSLLQEVHCFL